MALQKSITTQQGVVASSCYIKVSNFTGDKDNSTFYIELYFDANARTNGKQPLEHMVYQIPTPTTDLLPALYTYLKTLPEFSGALDV